MSLNQMARSIFLHAVDCVKPEELVKKSLHLVNTNTLSVNGTIYPLNKNVHVVGFGKAVHRMWIGVRDRLKHHIVGGCLSIPHGTLVPQDPPRDDALSCVAIRHGALNNFPDADAVANAMCIRKVMDSLRVDDVAIVLISGGGSALLPSPVPDVSLADKVESIKVVAAAGGNIKQLNLMRQQLSLTKGGRLLESCRSKNIISLIVSDVVGDPLEVIASGPTVPNNSTTIDCLNMFRQLNVQNDIPNSVMKHLESKASSETVAVQNESLLHCNNVIVGSNTVLVESARRKAIELGFKPYVLTTQLEGDATSFARTFTELVLRLKTNTAESQHEPHIKSLLHQLNVDVTTYESEGGFSGEKICLIMGGETTVKVVGEGRGGRNQHFILSALCRWRELYSGLPPDHSRGVCILSAGSDGQDGATDAAGAVCDGEMLEEVLCKDLDVHGYLVKCASYDFFSDYSFLGGLLKTGLTGTNVMDIQLALIDRTIPKSI